LYRKRLSADVKGVNMFAIDSVRAVTVGFFAEGCYVELPVMAENLFQLPGELRAGLQPLIGRQIP